MLPRLCNYFPIVGRLGLPVRFVRLIARPLARSSKNRDEAQQLIDRIKIKANLYRRGILLVGARILRKPGKMKMKYNALQKALWDSSEKYFLLNVSRCFAAE